MGNAPRSFNTVRNSRREQRIRKHRQGRIVLLSIIAVSALLLLMGLIFLIALGAHSCKKDPGTPDKPQMNGGEIRYEAITKSSTDDVRAGPLITVNSSCEYRFPSADKDSRTGLELATRTMVEGASAYQLASNEIYARSEALAALSAMLTDYYNLSGDNAVMLAEAFRTYTQQSDLNSATKAGFSDHHTGYLMTLKNASGNSSLTSDQKNWIDENCKKYGIVQRYPNGHSEHTGVSGYTYAYRYVGIPHAVYMTEHDMCLEDYVAFLKDNYTNKHLTVTAGNANYEIWYVPASESEITVLQVPANYSYTVSGDNLSGFIVTADLSAPK